MGAATTGNAQFVGARYEPKHQTKSRRAAGGGVMKTIDLRERCKRCGKIPRGKLNKANFERYKPFCSYNCQEWYGLEEAQRYINYCIKEVDGGKD